MPQYLVPLENGSKFSVVFSETRVNTGYYPLERPRRRALPTIGPGPTSGQLALILQTQALESVS